MKRTGKTFKAVSLCAFFVTAMFILPASAHFMWLNVGNYTPAAEEDLTLNIGWGHRFGNPVGNVLRELERVENITILDPSGGNLEVESINPIDFKTKSILKTEGTYLAAAKRKEGFFSKTTEGYKPQSKKGLKNVIECSYSGGYAKAIINVGKGGGDVFSKVLGHALEIVPLEDPANLKQGDYLPLKVLYKGEPLKTEIYAIYVGFSTEGAWAYNTSTDKDGKSQIKILQPGVWLVKVSYKTPYPDPEECDQHSFTATLTFEVK